MGKINKNCQIFIFGFQRGAKNIKGQLKIGFYSHIWLNLPRDDDHFVNPLVDCYSCYSGLTIHMAKFPRC